MKDFSRILLTNILRATFEHVQQSSEIDQAGAKDLKRTLLDQITRLAEIEPGSAQLTIREQHEVTRWITLIEP